MPSITIREIDTTSSSALAANEDVVFVPGFINANFVSAEGYAEAYEPTLCSSISEFESYFGTVPAQFAKAQDYPEGFAAAAKPESTGTTVEMYALNTMDTGYVYAKELLTAGLPVLYVRCNKTKDEITIEHLYDVLSGKTDYDVWSDIQDISEYVNLKFITSGGYPTFEYDPCIISPTLSNVSLDEFTQKNLLMCIPRTTVDQLCTFAYAYNAMLVEAVPTEEPAEGTEAYIRVVRTYTDSTPKDTGYRWLSKDSKWETLAEDELKALKHWSLKIDSGDWAAVNMADYGFTVNTATQDYGSKIVLTVPATTSGTSYLANKLISTAASRGDCVALIDHTDKSDRVLNPTHSKSVYYSVADIDSTYRLTSSPEFSAMFTPWCSYSYVSDLWNNYNNGSSTDAPLAIAPKYMPASFGYLKAYADSVQTNASWLAIAGAARGAANIIQPHLSSGLRLSNAIAEAYQPRSASGDYLGVAINPITKVMPYGYLIWGNRTLKANSDGLTATSFLNTRNMVSDIKKLAYKAAKKCMFEQNSDILWLNFKSMITPTLEQMVSANGLSGYKFIQGTTTEKAKLVCTIRIYPIYAVESFDITIELADDEVTIS